jgi:threonine synthase
MFSVQSDACAPVVRAFSGGMDDVDPSFPDGITIAAGLRVPRPFAGKQILSILRASGGGAVGVTEKEILDAVSSLAKEGVFACPEGAATLAGYERLTEDGEIDRSEQVLLYNTGTGLKYLNLLG